MLIKELIAKAVKEQSPSKSQLTFKK